MQKKALDVLWDAQFARLAAYKWAHGDCHVPQHGVEDPVLGNLVHTQRVANKKLDRDGIGLGTAMTAA